MTSDDEAKMFQPDTVPIGPTSPFASDREVPVVRTYLAMDAVWRLQRGTPPNPSLAPRVVPRPDCSVAEWRRLYAEIGGSWHWHDRDLWSDAQLAERLASPAVSVFRVVAQVAGNVADPAGFFEIERHTDGSAEIVYLGLVPRVIGSGLGAWVVGEAVDRAFALGVARVWLHTCTLDAPAALPNYLARGFLVERSETYFDRLRE